MDPPPAATSLELFQVEVAGPVHVALREPLRGERLAPADLRIFGMLGIRGRA